MVAKLKDILPDLPLGKYVSDAVEQSDNSEFAAALLESWAHKADAVPVWQAALNDFSRSQVMDALEQSIKRYQEYPPSLGQFMELCDPLSRRPMPNTYLPAPEVSPAHRAAQLTMFNVLGLAGGVEKFTLKLMIDLKNALVVDHGDSHADQEFIDNLHGQLMGLVEKQAA